MKSFIQMPEYGTITDEDWEYFLSMDAEDYLNGIEKSLRYENRFFVDNRFNKLLFFYATSGAVQDNSIFYIECGSVLYRARIYHEADAKDKASHAIPGEFNGYDYDASFVTTKKNASQGRANPEGIVYLYLSSSEKCAIAEVSPVLSDWVSVAKIEFTNRTKIFDLAKWTLCSAFSDEKRAAWAMSLMSRLDGVFSRPYRDKYDYLLSQYVCEFLKNVGYDGIRFFSSKVLQIFMDEKFINYTLFDYSKCKPISSDLIYVFNAEIDTKTFFELDSITYKGEVT